MEYELRRALVRNELGKVQDILTSGAISTITPENIPEGATVLHLAVILGYKDCVQILLSKAMSDVMINFQDDSSQWTPLMHALANNEPKIAKMLLKTGKCNVSIKDNFQQTALHIEAQSHSNTAEICYYIVYYGAEIDEEDSERMTPFLRAVEANNITAAKYLYNRRCNLGHCCKNGKSVLHIASQHCHEEMLVFLIRIGCSLTITDDKGQTPLMMCVQQRKPPVLVYKILKYLLDAGSPVNEQDCLGNTTLLLATSNPGVVKKQHIELLLSAGADPEVPNHDGLTPLWQGVYDGVQYSDRLQIIELFVSQNCYLDMCCRGRLLFMYGTNTVYSYETFLSPFEVAMDSGFYSAAKLLLKAGAQVPSDMRYESHYQEHIPQELVWFQELIQTPSALQHQCRLVIRAVLGRAIHNKVSKLPLPEKIKSFVLLQDLISEIQSS